MQKKLLAILSFVLLAGSNNVSLAKGEWDTLQYVGVVAGIAGIGAAGKYVSDMNQEYAKTGKRPDLKMRTAKILGTATMMLGTDILLHKNDSTAIHLAKIGAFAISALAITDTAANIVREIPGVGGLLTEPADENGNEEKDLGAVARVLLLYVPLSKLAVDFVSKS